MDCFMIGLGDRWRRYDESGVCITVHGASLAEQGREVLGGTEPEIPAISCVQEWYCSN